jgi:hypothetical protein
MRPITKQGWNFLVRQDTSAHVSHSNKAASEKAARGDCLEARPLF